MRIRFPYRFFWYVLTESLPYIFFTFLILTLLIFAQQLSKQNELLFSTSAATVLSLKLMLYLLPGIFVITIPFALLIGSLMSLNRLSSDSEVIAARSSGMDIFQIASPILLLGLTGVFFSAYLTLNTIPKIYAESRELKSRLVLLALTTPIKPKSFENHFPNHLVYIRDIDKENGDWLGVFILSHANPKETVVLTAKRGTLRMTQTSPVSLEVVLSQGILTSSGSAAPERQSAIGFTQQAIRLSSDNSATLNAFDKLQVNQELTTRDLLLKSGTQQVAVEKRQTQVEFHKRFSLPLSCLILTLVSIPFGVSSHRQSGKAVAFTIGFLLAVIYYLISIAGQNFSLSGVLPPWLGMWLANLCGLLVTLALWSTRNFNLSDLVNWKLLKRDRVVTPRTPTDKTRLIKHKENALSFKLSSEFSHRVINLINYLLVTELAKYFSLTLSILIFTSLIFTLFDLVPALSRSQLGAGYVGVYLLYLSPQIMYIVMPFGFMLGLLTLYGVLSRSNQITALLSSGQSILRLSLPVFVGTLAVIASMFWISERILPTSNQIQDSMYNKIKGKKMEMAVTAFGQSWVRDSNSTIYGYQFNPLDKKLLNTSIFQISPESDTIEGMYHIQEAIPSSQNTWEIIKGWSSHIGRDLQIDYLRFPSSSIPGFITIPEGTEIFTHVVNEASKMSFFELRGYIHYLSDLGIPTTSLRVDLEKKLAFPFSCLTLIMISLPITITTARRGNLAGMGISILIGLSFWIIAGLFENAGRQAYLPAGLCVWGPQALFMAMGGYLLFRKK